MTNRVLVASLRATRGSRCGALEVPARGRSATRRAAIASGSRCADVLSGSAEMSEVILSVAASFGMRAKLAASSQGSRSSRASAEMTLSNIPFLSSPIGANRKLSNSDREREAEAERVIAVTEFGRLRGDMKLRDVRRGAMSPRAKSHRVSLRRVSLARRQDPDMSNDYKVAIRRIRVLHKRVIKKRGIRQRRHAGLADRKQQPIRRAVDLKCVVALTRIKGFSHSPGGPIMVACR
jgi:hypothetical protein